MKNFNELLKEYIDTQGVAIYQISKQADINRTFIQNVIAGRKKFPQKRLDFPAVLCYTMEVNRKCRRSLVVKWRLPKPQLWVRFPSPAP